MGAGLLLQDRPGYAPERHDHRFMKLVEKCCTDLSGPEKVEFVIPKKAVSVVIDFFGKHVRFHEEEDGTVTCSLLVSRESMKRWAVQMAGTVRVVSPPELVEEVREEIRKAAALYGMEKL